MKAEPKRCPTCNAKMVEYKQGLSKGLLRGLVKALRYIDNDRQFEIGEVRSLTYSERENLRKLQYWRVIEKQGDKDSKGGCWRVTDIGMAFVKGEIVLRKFAWTYRGEFVRFDGPRLAITDLTDGWKYRPDYAREAQPQQNPGQAEML